MSAAFPCPDFVTVWCSVETPKSSYMLASSSSESILSQSTSQILASSVNSIFIVPFCYFCSREILPGSGPLQSAERVHTSSRKSICPSLFSSKTANSLSAKLSGKHPPSACFHLSSFSLQTARSLIVANTFSNSMTSLTDTKNERMRIWIWRTNFTVSDVRHHFVKRYVRVVEWNCQHWWTQSPRSKLVVFFDESWKKL